MSQPTPSPFQYEFGAGSTSSAAGTPNPARKRKTIMSDDSDDSDSSEASFSGHGSRPRGDGNRTPNASGARRGRGEGTGRAGASGSNNATPTSSSAHIARPYALGNLMSSPAAKRKRMMSLVESPSSTSSPHRLISLLSDGGAGGAQAPQQQQSSERITSSLDGSLKDQQMQSPRQNQTSSTNNNGGEAQLSEMGNMLSILDKDQLVGLLTTVLNSYPVLQPHVASLLPKPTLPMVTQLLQQCEKKISDSLPYSKWGPDDKTDYSFNRVRPALSDLKQTLLHYLTYFTSVDSYPPHMQHEYPACAFGYLHVATCTVHRLPVWNNPRHNAETKHDLYGQLGRVWRSVIMEVGRRVKEEGKVFGTGVVGEWARNLVEHNREVKGHFGFEEALEEFQRQLGWIYDQTGGMMGVNPGFGGGSSILESLSGFGGGGGGVSLFGNGLGGIAGGNAGGTSGSGYYPWPMAAGHTPQQGLLSSPFALPQQNQR
ncbi:Tethering factor for nuclear proteasome sts1 [Quaeritorhiza haematococci]|nr:Tethering factor for nuclear proteasome sts1 [Quaeritorhiza haematococci]